MTPLENDLPWDPAKYFALLLEVVHRYNLLEHEILPEHKCFQGQEANSSFLFFFLGNTVVMPTVTEQQAAATASDEARLCLTAQLPWEGVN